MKKQRVVRSFTDEQRNEILAAYEAAPVGTKHLVATKYRVAVPQICGWRVLGRVGTGKRAAVPVATKRHGRRGKRLAAGVKAEILGEVAALRRDGNRGAVAARRGISLSTIHKWGHRAGNIPITPPPPTQRVKQRVSRAVGVANTALARVNGHSLRSAIPAPAPPPASGPGPILQMMLRRLKDEAGVELRSLRVRRGTCRVTYQVTQEFAL